MPSDDQARAIAEVAKFGRELVVGIRGVAAYLGEVVGSIPSDLLGVGGGDWLSEVRKRNVARLMSKTTKILNGIDNGRISEPSPSVLIPLLQAVTDESREELQDLWAALLANSLLDGGHRVRREFFVVLQQMEPSDAAALKFMARLPPPTRDTGDAAYQSRFAALEAVLNGPGSLGFRVSMRALNRLGCVTPDGSLNELHTAVSDFGVALLAACEVPSDARETQATTGV